MPVPSAFAPYRRPERAEALPLVNPAPFNLVAQATAGIRAWCRPEAPDEPSTEPAESERSGWEAGAPTLGDGRLDVGTHSPLLGKRYRYLNLLGEGTSGQVILARDTLQPGSCAVAIKITKRQHAYAGQKEVRLLRWLRSVAPHAALVPVRDVFSHASHVCAVLPLLPHSLLDLLAHMAAWDPLPRLEHARRLTAVLLATLADMHERGVVHADLKPENLLLAHLPECRGDGLLECPEMRVIDLGSSFSVTSTDTAQLSFEAQTLPYRAPEVVLQQPCGPPMDLWSAGCILAELLLQEPLFPADTPSQLLARFRERLGEDEAAEQQAAQLETRTPSHLAGSRLVPRKCVQGAFRGAWTEGSCVLRLSLARVDAAATDLVMRLLARDPAQRLTAAQALAHPFLAPLLPLRHAAAAAAAPLPQAQARASGSLSAQPSARQERTPAGRVKQAGAAAPQPKSALAGQQQPSGGVQLGADCRGQAGARPQPQRSHSVQSPPHERAGGAGAEATAASALLPEEKASRKAGAAEPAEAREGIQTHRQPACCSEMRLPDGTAPSPAAKGGRSAALSPQLPTARKRKPQATPCAAAAEAAASQAVREPGGSGKALASSSKRRAAAPALQPPTARKRKPQATPQAVAAEAAVSQGAREPRSSNGEPQASSSRGGTAAPAPAPQPATARKRKPQLTPQAAAEAGAGQRELSDSGEPPADGSSKGGTAVPASQPASTRKRKPQATPPAAAEAGAGQGLREPSGSDELQAGSSVGQAAAPAGGEGLAERPAKRRLRESRAKPAKDWWVVQPT